ncbi:MAG TPA: DUF123 domain-containing protein, partial [Pirellulaceae bacterium]|nr:DUF123 domain-containing protein [Pirellulaceae bacterium]
MKTIVTHKRPDLDAIVSAWLAQDFLFAGQDSQVVFVDRGRVPRLKDSADCLVDVGNEHDPSRLRFDHKPPAFPNRRDSCAAKLVWEYLFACGLELHHLAELIQITFEGDTLRSSPALRASRESGPHAKLAELKKCIADDDDDVYHRMVVWLRTSYCQNGGVDQKLIQRLGNEPGTYALVFRCDATTDLTIGKLGILTTEPGFYVYTGSAFGPGGIEARVSRHIRTDKRPRWNIDYLRPFAQLLEIWHTHDPQRRECSWSHALASMKTTTVPLQGFGASDCEHGCETHLYFFLS